MPVAKYAPPILHYILREGSEEQCHRLSCGTPLYSDLDLGALPIVECLMAQRISSRVIGAFKIISIKIKIIQ